MNVVISQGNKKRILEGSFSICINKRDLRAIIDQLKRSDTEGFHYGWITIYPHVEVVVDTPPEPWSEK